MDSFKKLMEKKAGKEKPMDPLKQKAKMSMLEHLRDMAKEMMMEDLKSGLPSKEDGLKKVTVASDSKEGLQEGLEKAEELIGGEESEEGDELGDDHAAKIAELLKLKAAKK